MIPVIEDGLFDDLDLLFRYRAGDSLGNATFSRGSSATYIDANGVLQTASSNVARDGHYIGGVRSLLLEGQRTNRCLASEDLSSGSWTKTGAVGLSANAGVAPDGNTTADQLTLGAKSTKDLAQGVTGLGASAAVAVSFWIKTITAGTGTLTVDNAATGTAPVTFTPPAAGAGFSLITIAQTATAGGNAGPWFFSSDGSDWTVQIWGVQVEAGAFASSYIATAGSAVTRSADALSFTVSFGSQTRTTYCDHYKLADSGILWAQAETGTGAKELYAHTPSASTYASNYQGNPANYGTAPASSAIGDRVELRTVLPANGAVQSNQAKNGGAEASGVAATAEPLSSATVTTIWFGRNASGSNAPAVAIKKLVVLKGTKTQSQCQAA